MSYNSTSCSAVLTWSDRLDVIGGDDRYDLTAAYYDPDSGWRPPEVLEEGGAAPGVLAFARDPNTGRLSELNFVALDPEIAFLDDLIVSPDGRHVYISHLFPPTIVALERLGE